MQMIYPGKAQLRVRTACSETCVQVTCWHIISCLSALRITVDFLLKAFTSHICSCIYYRFIPGSGGKWLSRSAPNPISLSKERHKHLLLGIWNTLKKEQHPPKSARQGWSLGLGCFPQALPRSQITEKSRTGHSAQTASALWSQTNLLENLTFCTTPEGKTSTSSFRNDFQWF